MTQTTMFPEPGLEPKVQAIAKEKREQQKQLRRVTGRIRGAIEGFFKARLDSPSDLDRVFTMIELQQHVDRTVEFGAAPGSTDRILRLLRQDGHLNYRCIDRGASLYQALPAGRAP